MHAQRDRSIYILFWRLLWLPQHTHTHTLSSSRSWMHTNENTSSSNSSCYCCCNRRKKKVIPVFVCMKFSLFFLTQILVMVEQEKSVPLSSLYMSSELDTCILGDVIVIVYVVRETLSMHSMVETSSWSLRWWERLKRKEDTRIGAQTDPPLACFYLRRRRRRRKAKCRARIDNNYVNVSCWLYYLHHHHQRPIADLVGTVARILYY
jgi:hypothetical protein